MPDGTAKRQDITPLDLRSPGFKDAPDRLWSRLHGEGPIVTTRQPLLGRLALATSHQASLDVLRDDSRFTVDARRVGQSGRAGVQWWVPSVFRVLAENMLTTEGTEHRRLRGLVDKAFQKASLNRLQPRIEVLSEAALTRLERAQTPDLVRDVARPLPVQVISELLGLTDQSPTDAARLARALDRLSGIRGAMDLFRVVPSIMQIRKALTSAIDQRRHEPGEDLLSELVSVRIDDDRLSENELLSMIFLLYVAGHETTTHLISTGLLTLLREPGIRDQLSLPLSTQMVTEVLRHASPVQFSKPRFVVSDMTFHGAILHRGDTISALIGCANRDPRWICEPDRLDLARPATRQLGFGAGAHVCLGLQLALRETATVLTRLFDRFPHVQLQQRQDMPDWTDRLGLRSLHSLPLRLR